MNRPIQPPFADGQEHPKLVIRRFEDAWNCRLRPAIQGYVPVAGHEHRSYLAVELAHIDLEYRLKAGDQAPLVEMYFQQFPAELSDPEVAVELIEAEYLRRWLREPGVKRDEYLERFRQYRERLESRLRPRWECPGCRHSIRIDVIDEAIETIDCPNCNRPYSIRRQPQDSIPLATKLQLQGSQQRNWPMVSGYDIVEELGHGGMGVVYRAWERGASRWVALKMLLAGIHASSDDITRFREEAKAAGQLVHDNIVRLYAVSLDDRQAFFVIEFVEGGNLAVRLGGIPQDPRDSAELTEKLSRAMQHAHERGVIHRDLKPSNVLITLDGTPKIADFGLAKRLNVASDNTNTGRAIGTPSYMSPEQAEGKASMIGPTTDVYALGANLYEMLTGYPPFKAATVLDTLEQVRHHEPVAPRSRQPMVPRDLETICLKCLQKDPASRYATAGALAEDLGRWLDGQPIQARPVGKAERLWKWCRRNPAPTALVSVFVLALLAGLITSVWVYDREVDNGVKLQGALGQKETALERATSAEGVANRSSETARVKEAEALRSLHTANLNLAFKEWGRGNLQGVLSLLRQHLPKEGREDLRGFEWYFLWSRCNEHRARMLGHESAVTTLAFSPDGCWLASGAGEAELRNQGRGPGEIILRDARSGAAVGCLPHHRLLVTALAFSPDSRLLASASMDRSVCLWDVSTRRPLVAFTEQGDGVTCLAFSPLGDLLACGDTEGTVRVWDLIGRRFLASFATVPNDRPLPNETEPRVRRLHFSPDGTRLLVHGWPSRLSLWDTKELKEVPLPISLPRGPVDIAIFVPGTPYLAVVRNPTRTYSGGLREGPSEHAQVAFVPIDGSNPLLVPRPLKGHEGGIYGMTCSTDGRLISTVDETDTIRIWNWKQEHRLAVYKSPSPHPYTLQFSPSGTAIAAGTSVGPVILWDVPSSPIDYVLPPGNRFNNSFHLCRRRTLALLSTFEKGAHQLTLWDLAAGRSVGPVLPKEEFLPALFDLSPDRRFVAMVGSGFQDDFEHKDVAIVWDMLKRQVAWRLDGHEARIEIVAFSSDDQYLFSVDTKGTGRLWSVARRECIASIQTTDTPPLEVSFSPERELLALPGRDGSISLRELPSLKERRRLVGHGARVSQLDFSRETDTFASADIDGDLILWNLKTWEPRWRKKVQPLTNLRFAPDGRTLLICESDTVRFLDPVTGDERGHLPLPTAGRSPRDMPLIFAPDGKTLFIGGGQLLRWEAAQEEEISRTRDLAGSQPVLALLDAPEITAPGQGPRRDPPRRAVLDWMRLNLRDNSSRTRQLFRKAIDDTLATGGTFRVLVGPEMTWDARPRLIHRHAGTLFTFPLDEKQSAYLGLKSESWRIVGLKTILPERLQMPPPVSLANASLDGKGPVDPRSAIRGRVSCRVDREPVGMCFLRLTYHLNNLSVVRELAVKVPTRGEAILEWRAEPLLSDERGFPARYSGPVVVFLDLCLGRPSEAPKEVTVVSNSVAILLDVSDSKSQGR